MEIKCYICGHTERVNEQITLWNGEKKPCCTECFPAARDGVIVWNETHPDNQIPVPELRGLNGY